jgi:hypothetical protein
VEDFSPSSPLPPPPHPTQLTLDVLLDGVVGLSRRDLVLLARPLGDLDDGVEGGRGAVGGGVAQGDVVPGRDLHLAEAHVRAVVEEGEAELEGRGRRPLHLGEEAADGGVGQARADEAEARGVGPALPVALEVDGVGGPLVLHLAEVGMLTRPVRGEVGEGDGVPPRVAREEGDGVLGLGLGQGLAEAGVEGAEVVAGDAAVAVVVEEVENVPHGGHLLRGERDLAAVVEDAARVAVLVLAVGGQDLVVGVVVGCGEEAGVLVGEGRGEGGEVRGRAVRGGLRRPRRRRGAEEVVVVVGGGGGGDARGVRHGRELGEVGLAVLAQGADLVLEEDAARAAGEPRGRRRPLGARAPAARVAQEGETGTGGPSGGGGRGRKGEGNCCLNSEGRRNSPSINVDDTRVRHDDDERTAATRGEGERTANRVGRDCGTGGGSTSWRGVPRANPATRAGDGHPR